MLDLSVYRCTYRYATSPCTRLLANFMSLEPAAGGGGPEEVPEGPDGDVHITPPLSRTRLSPSHGAPITVMFDGGTEGQANGGFTITLPGQAEPAYGFGFLLPPAYTNNLCEVTALRRGVEWVLGQGDSL